MRLIYSIYTFNLQIYFYLLDMHRQLQVQGGLTPLGQAKFLFEAFSNLKAEDSPDIGSNRLSYHSGEDQDMLKKLELKWRKDLKRK